MDDDAIADLFAGLGPVQIRRMFGGKGIYHQGTIIAVVVEGELLLKADAESAPAFQAAGCRRWNYGSRSLNRPVSMPYWSVPPAALDDAEEMTPWARLAFQAALRSERTRETGKKAR